MHGFDGTMPMITENGLDAIMMINSDSPRLAVTPGEWYASAMLTLLSCDLRQMNSAMFHSRTELGFAQVDSVAEEDVSAGRDGNYGTLKIDSTVVDYGTGAVGLDDLIFRRLSFLPEEFGGGWDVVMVVCDAMKFDDMNFRRTSFPLDELSAGRDGDYTWLNSGTGLSVCARLVTGSLRFGHPHRLLSFHCLERVLTPDCHCRTTVVRITPDICYSRHTWRIEGYVFCSSIIVVLIIWYCFGAMASDGLPDREQAGPSCAPSGPLPGTFLGPALDIRSESLCELGPDILDVMGLRALRPEMAAVKVMSVRDSRCIRVVTPVQSRGMWLP